MMNKKCYVSNYCGKEVDVLAIKSMQKLTNFLIENEKVDSFIFDNDEEFCDIFYDFIMKKNNNFLCQIVNFNFEFENKKLNLEKIKINTYKKGAEVFLERQLSTIDLCDYCVFFVDFLDNFPKYILFNYAIKNNKKIFFVLKNCDRFLILN